MLPVVRVPEFQYESPVLSVQILELEQFFGIFFYVVRVSKFFVVVVSGGVVESAWRRT